MPARLHLCIFMDSVHACIDMRACATWIPVLLYARLLVAHEQIVCVARGQRHAAFKKFKKKIGASQQNAGFFTPATSAAGEKTRHFRETMVRARPLADLTRSARCARELARTLTLRLRCARASDPC